MKIRTQVIISIVIFGIALLIITASVVTTNQRVDQMNKQVELANKIEIGASELGYLSNDYLLFHESQQFDVWNTKYASFSDDISNLTVDTPEQRAVLDNIKANQRRLKEVFNDVASNIQSTDNSQNNAIDPVITQISWSRLGVQTRGIVFDASRLSMMLQDELNQVKQTNSLLISTLLGTFILFLLIDYLLIYGNIVRSLSDLRAGTRSIGSGNFDVSLKVKKDEIGELAHAFNQMADRLKTVTASKSDLEREVQVRRQVEEALIKAKEQAELYLDLMGHDISNMHQIMEGQLELAQETMAEEGKLEGDEKELIDTPLQILDRSNKLIENVRKLQKLEAGQYKSEPVDIGSILGDVAVMYSQVPGKDATIDYTPVKSCYVEANPLLKDIFANLVDNAVKHSGSGGSIHIGIKVDEVREDGRAYYRVAVEDNGPGISDENKGIVFHRLERGKTKARGTGLGLYIVKTLVESFHGKVKVEDRVPDDYTKGSRFLVYLPVSEAEHAK